MAMRGAAELAGEITEQLAAIGTPERAASERRYLKSELEFLGATVWEIRRVIGAFDRSLSLDRAGVMSLVEELWRPPVHERRMAAVALLERHVADLEVADLALVERLIRASRTWALSDGLATNVIGPLLVRHPDVADAWLERWARDDDFWIRRTALLAEIEPLRNGASFERFARHADAMLEEREFFIRKAIGWVLREVSKRRPADVLAFIAPRTGRASGVTMREVVKYLPDAAAELMAAYRAGRPATAVAE
jgi:3-methyladenine DNA glycosylase AlkD